MGEGKSLADIYAGVILERAESLRELSSKVVADAWFAKSSFIGPLKEAGLEVISRLRGDARLLYLYGGPREKKPGRPKQYDGRVDPQELNLEHFQLVASWDEEILHTAVVHSVSLGMKVRLVHTQQTNASGKCSYKLYFSTDLEMPALDILKAYRTRFQIEFLYRDGKQHTASMRPCLP